MADVQVTRWKRYGKDRLYVKGPGASDLGWVDLISGERHITDLPHSDAFNAAVDSWYAAAAPATDGSPSPVADVVPSQPDHPEEPAPATDAGGIDYFVDATRSENEPPTWHDLADHVPGQAARQQAARELAAMRERTRVGTFVARALDKRTDERAWRVGTGGEETIGARLERLTKHGWHVLHAVPIGDHGSDIDHVVIGPGGVFTLNTKTHPGAKIWVGEHAIRVNGQPVPYLRNSRYEAERVTRLLTYRLGFTVLVRPVLVFLTGTFIPNVTIKQRPQDVSVYDRMDIPRVFKRAPQLIDPDRVETIYAAARRCTTWTGTARCSCAVRA